MGERLAGFGVVNSMVRRRMLKEDKESPDLKDALDAMEEGGPSSLNEKFSNVTSKMVVDDDDDMYFDDSDSDDEAENCLQELGKEFLKGFCKKISTAFIEQYGLISHQINSYNDFIKHGIQQMFNSIGEIVVEPGYDPSKRGDGDWRYASLKFGKVTLEQPTFWTGEKFSAEGGKEFLEMYPWHARL
ncbi:unnamed protein product [Fraxinus pennsylvanica]|uniref:DNA-directed RNA polymerase n=1 Tax=Fraxinus pennsylvanica TaxID=56036 RepID=A0AAD1ZUJ8_9LAMI|nr:unnamed protein product [Fraxinus pennsylvanica]